MQVAAGPGGHQSQAARQGQRRCQGRDLQVAVEPEPRLSLSMDCRILAGKIGAELQTQQRGRMQLPPQAGDDHRVRTQ